MAKISVQMLGDTLAELNVTGDKIKADSFFGMKDGLHQVSWSLEDFTGRIFLEATLESDPQEGDWFSIFLDGSNAFIEYPLIPLSPTGSNGDTMVDSFTFLGNFLYVRVRMDRSFVRPVPSTEAEIAELGSIKKVLLNH